MFLFGGDLTRKDSDSKWSRRKLFRPIRLRVISDREMVHQQGSPTFLIRLVQEHRSSPQPQSKLCYPSQWQEKNDTVFGTEIRCSIPISVSRQDLRHESRT